MSVNLQLPLLNIQVCIKTSKFSFIFVDTKIILFYKGPAPDACEAYIQDSSVASILAMYYTLSSARHKDRIGLLRILAILVNCQHDRCFEDSFLHTLVALLLPMSEEFTTEDFCTGLFDEFFSNGLGKENVVKHLLKLLWYVHGKLPQARVVLLMKILQPSTQVV